jgi:archaellum biogenesis ATPase FlaH
MRPDPYARPQHPPSGAGIQLLLDLIEGTFRLLGAYRIELALTGLVWLIYGAALEWVGSPEGELVTAAVLVAIMAVGPVRRFFQRMLHRARMRRRLVRGCRRAGLSTNKGAFPHVRKLHPTPSGDVATVLLPPGMNADYLAKSAETLAASMGLREVRVLRDAGNASVAYLSLIVRDALSETQPLAWPRRGAAQLSLWDPIPIGVDEDGQRVTVALPERNLLLGGEPGAGKSVALSQLVATAALDPACRLWLLDGKLVELAPWRQVAQANVGVSVSEANEVLARLQAEMDQRYEELLATRRRKVTASDPWPLEVVVCDELAHYLTAGDRKTRQEFAERMRDLVARGRAAGVIVLAATQKPSHDIIPTSLRDLFGFRWALRCSTPQASDTVLGQGWAAQGYSAATIDSAARGVGFLLHQGGLPVRLRSFHLSDADLDDLAMRAETLRSHAGLGETG